MATNMSNHRHEVPGKAGPGFWRSRTGLAFLLALAVGAVLLGYEHRLHLLGSNLLLLVPLLLCVGMHVFMHGGHGSDAHGGPAKGGGAQAGGADKTEDRT